MKPLTITLSVEDTTSLHAVAALSGVEPQEFMALLLASALAEIETVIKRRAGLAPKKEATHILEFSGFSGTAFRSLDRLLNKKPLRKGFEPLGSGSGEGETE